MNLPETNLPDRKSWNAAASPSNLAMAALVGFLFLGQATDWKILGRKSKASSSVKFGAPELTRNGLPGARRVRAGSLPEATRETDRKTTRETTNSDPNSEEVADRRPASRETQRSPGQLD